MKGRPEVIVFAIGSSAIPRTSTRVDGAYRGKGKLKILTNKWFLIIVVITVIAAAAAFTLRDDKKTQYFTATASRGDVRSIVEATGTINAVTSVQVGSQVSGTISELLVDFNSRVKKGQVIARIDPSLLQGALGQATADLENARANVAAARANLEKAKAAAIQAKQDFDRAAGLAQAGVFSQSQLDAARATYDAAAAQVNANEAALTQAQAQVRQREAAVNVAQTNLKHTIITAPIDGTVVARSVDVGQTVAASLQAPTLFTIAQDLTKMQVYAKTDESDVGQIRPGQRVMFKVDAFPKEDFGGRVVQVRMNATTVQNVVTYDTVIQFDNPEMKLFPGMTAYVSIPVQEAMNVLRVPNGAIRYKPDMKPEELQALLQKYGMDPQSLAEARRSRRQGGGNAAPQPTSASAASPQVAAAQTPQRGAGAPAVEQNGGADQERVPREASPEMATVWKLRPDKSLEPIRLRLGITDHTETEVVQVVKGELKEGDTLVIGSSAARTSTATGAPGATRPPSMGMGGGGRR